jgi:hypothetical protein
MMMQMLEAGGLPILTDRLRAADESNPQGYYELERVKELDKNGDTSWLREARGSAVKIIAYLLAFLPESLNYKVVFMRRDLDEILASQAKMLAARGESTDTDDQSMRRFFEDHLARSERLLTGRTCFDVLQVGYADILSAPAREAERVGAFLGGASGVRDPLGIGVRLDPSRAASAVEPSLYRNRGPSI